MSEDNQGKESAMITRLWHRCVDHASDLLAAAGHISDDLKFHNIGYHLTLLAIEEIGKANMIVARTVLKTAGRPDRITNQLDDHVSKLVWAMWVPGSPVESMTPKRFREVQQFAVSAHFRRQSGLYVDFEDQGDAPAPKDAIDVNHSKSVFEFAKALLEIAQAGEPDLSRENDDLQWFASAMDDDRRRALLLSAEFSKKHSEAATSKEWFLWARAETERIENEEAELAKKALIEEKEAHEQIEPRWRLKSRIRTPSHSIRPKALSFWNSRFEFIKLREVQGRKDELIVEIELTNEVAAAKLHDAGMAVFIRVMLALNVSTAGFFWYEIPRQGDSFFYDAEDLLNPNTKVELVRDASVNRVWRQFESQDERRGPPALNEHFIQDAVFCLLVLGSLTDQEAQPIVGNYIWAMSLLSKFDVHISFENDVGRMFKHAFKSAIKHFGDWDGQSGSLRGSFDQIFRPLLAKESEIDKIYELISDENAEQKFQFDDVIALKRMVDMYLIQSCRRLAPTIIARTK